MYGAKKPPHPATVTQRSTPHLATVVQTRMPHPATVVQRRAGASVAQRMEKPQPVSSVDSTHELAITRSTIKEAIAQVIAALKVKKERESAYSAKSKIDKAILELDKVGALDGYVATVTNADRAYYYVPDGREKPINLNLLAANLAKLPEGQDSHEWRKTLPSEWSDFLAGEKKTEWLGHLTETKALTVSHGSSKNYTKAKNIGFNFPKLLEEHRAELVPLYTLKQWHDLFASKEYSTKLSKKTKNFKLMVNANWFNIQGLTAYPQFTPLTYMMGLSVRKGRVISSHERETEHKGNRLDALAVFDDGPSRKITVLSNNEIASVLRGVRFAVGGFIVVRAGTKIVRNEASASPIDKKRRTGVGISDGGKRLHVVVVETEIVLAELSELFLHLGDHDAIDLDNSGSSQMVFDGTEQTKPADGVKPLGNDKYYRPVPNFFAVSDRPITKDDK